MKIRLFLFFILSAGLVQNASAQAISNAALIDSVQGHLSGYVFPEKIGAISNSLAAFKADPDLNKLNCAAFADSLNKRLQQASGDKHLRLFYNPDSAKHPDRIGDLAKSQNQGFDHVEVLKGNVGYIDIRGFYPGKEARQIMADAFGLVKNTDALIIDLRINGGGEMKTTAMVISYLLPTKPQILYDFVFPHDRRRNALKSVRHLPGTRYYGKQVYILTSHSTFSGAEALAYALQAAKRAVIIGDTTAGGANITTLITIAGHFLLSLPVGSPINPITGKNWEGSGVIPDIYVPSAKAPQLAYEAALNKGQLPNSSGVIASVHSNRAAGNITDGPYVFYHNGQVIVKNIVYQNGAAKALIDSFPENQKLQHLLRVNCEGHPEWNFTVQLNPELLSPAVTTAGATKTLILSDIEGEFEPFRNLLLAAKVIEGNYKWLFGNGNLVIAGDLFDRGRQVSQFLWLLYKLEDEAAEKGGAVHVILGNHDIMNMEGDFRYVQPEYMNNAALLGEHYSHLYGPNTELGRWLRGKNTIEKIGDLLVTHGGMSAAILNKQESLSAIDAECRPFYDRPVPDSLKDFFNVNALFWYRGYFLDPKATQGLVDSTLAFYDCKKIIVGHDIIDHVAAFYNAKVIGVDVDEHEGTHEALLIEKNKYYRIDDKGNKVLLDMK